MANKNITPQGFLAQAKEYFTEKLDSVREAIGLSNDFPQAQFKHDKEYLNDIANGRWNKLKHVNTVDKCNSWRNMDWKNYKLRKWDRASLWKSINSNDWKLRRAETKDTTRPTIDRGFKLRKLGDQRKNLLNDIRQFDAQKLRRGPSPSSSYRQYLGDIENIKWKPLRKTEVNDKTDIRRWQSGQFQLNRMDRKPLLESIKQGTKLNKADTLDKSNPLIEKNVKTRRIGDQRKKMLKDIEGFGGSSKLNKTEFNKGEQKLSYKDALVGKNVAASQ